MSMSRISVLLQMSLHVIFMVTVSNAQIRSVPDFPGDAQEQFDDCEVVFETCMAPDCNTLFGSPDNTLCTANGSRGLGTSSSTPCCCRIPARSAPFLVLSGDGWVRYTFDPPIARFGGYFAGRAARGENGDAFVRFLDEQGNLLGTRVARIGDGECRIGDGWHWGGWESTGALIAEVEVEGMLWDGAFIGMDDMEISYEAEIQCDLVRRLKLSCRGDTLKAVVKTQMESGTRLTIVDMDISKSVKVNRRGKAKAKFASRPGRHRVYIEECPKFDEVVQCED